MKNSVLSCCVVLLIATCASSQDAVSYSRQVRPILAKHCFACHNGKSHKGGLNLETSKALNEGGDNGPVLVPGKAAESRLVVLMEGKQKPLMPPAKVVVRPTAAEIEIVRSWVNAGAKDDGEIKVALPDIKPKSNVGAPVNGIAFLAPIAGPADQSILAIAHDTRLTFSGAMSLKTNLADDPTTALASSNSYFAARATGRPGSHGRIDIISIRSPDRTLVSPTPAKHDDVILDLAVGNRAGERLVAAASYDSRISIMKVSRFISIEDEIQPPRVDLIHTLKDHSDAVYGVAFHPDAKRLASCSADRTIKIWDTATGSLVQTLSESTDWLSTIAWSPDGKLIAAGGVDRSIRLYQWNGQEARISRSTFAHEGPVLKLAFSPDGKNLYSLGQDHVVKVWNPADMSERRVFAPLPESGLTLAVHPSLPRIAVGRYDGVVQVFDVETGATVEEIKPVAAPAQPKPASEPKAEAKIDDPFPSVQEMAGNDSPGRGQKVSLPANVHGHLDRSGDVDYFQFTVAKGQPLGVEVIVPNGGKLESQLQLSDLRGNILADSERGFLGHTFADAGAYAIGIRDRELRGGADFKYRLRLGEIPIVEAAFPLGGQRGTNVRVQLTGVFLDAAIVAVDIPKDAMIGGKVAIPAASKLGTPRGMPTLVVGEFPEQNIGMVGGSAKRGDFLVPGTANGVIRASGAEFDRCSFVAKKGEKLVVEIEARRLGSRLDSVIEILDAAGNVVPRATLRCQAKTYTTFRDHDSTSGKIRLEHWAELNVNDLLYVNGELMKIKMLPPHPDDDCSFFAAGGNRLTYLDTTPTHHAASMPMYKVSVHPPGTKFPANGFPVFTVPYRNDDGGPGYGRDSRLIFDPPADGIYRVAVRDARGQGGPGYGFRLTIRPPQPRFTVSFAPAQPTVAKGGATSLALAVDRLDGFDGPVELRFENVPKGFHLPPTRLDGGDWATAVALFADATAQIDAKAPPLTLVGEAMIGGKLSSSSFQGNVPKVEEPVDLMTTTESRGLAMSAGGEAKLLVRIERRNGFKGRVPLEVRGLPHGVRVLDVGLNGILINEDENERWVSFASETWVEARTYPIVVLSRREGKSEHAAKAVMLTIGK